VCANGRIAGICEGAGLSVAEAGDIVFIAAEVLLFRGPVYCQIEREGFVRNGRTSA
jgi:hypothetical protein